MRHPPKSPISTAIRYGLGQWDELGRFLDNPCIPLDNNASERSLRRVALGRKNYLFVGDVDAGTNIAGLYTLVATCEARAINPLPTRATWSPACRITRPSVSTSCCPVTGCGPARRSSRHRSPDGYF